MKRIFLKITVSLVSVGFMVITMSSGVFLLSSPAFAECITKYRTNCIETDDKGRCKKYERVSYEECTEPKKPVNVSPPTEECYECIEYYNDGSCRKTKKVPC